MKRKQDTQHYDSIFRTIQKTICIDLLKYINSIILTAGAWDMFV